MKVEVPIYQPENVSAHMSLDEKTIDGDTYTVLSSRDTQKIALMAITLRNKPLVELLKSFDTMKVISL